MHICNRNQCFVRERRAASLEAEAERAAAAAARRERRLTELDLKGYRKVRACVRACVRVRGRVCVGVCGRVLVCERTRRPSPSPLVLGGRRHGGGAEWGEAEERRRRRGGGDNIVYGRDASKHCERFCGASCGVSSVGGG